MLTSLGRLISKRYKVVIVIWIVAAVLSIPLASRLDKVLSYNEQEFLPSQLESLEASRLLAEKFPGYEPPSLIVLIRHDVKDQALRKSVEEFRQRALQELEYVEDVITPYDIYGQVLEFYWAQMNRTRQAIAGQMLGNLTMLHQKLWSLTQSANMTLRLIYGLPAMYLAAWQSAVQSSPPETPISLVSSQVLNATLAQIPPINPLAPAYLKRVVNTWSLYLENTLGPEATVGDAGAAITSGTLDPAALMVTAVRDTAPQFFAAITDEVTAKKVAKLAEAFSLENYSDPEALRQFIVKAVMAQASMGGFTVPREVVEQLYTLGPDAPAEALQQIAETLADRMIEQVIEQHPPPRFPEGIPEKLRSRFISKAGDTMLILVSLAPECPQNVASDNAKKLYSILDDTLKAHGVDAEHYVTGTAAFSADLEEASRDDVSRIDKVTVVLVILLLAALLLSPIAPGVPLFTVGMAIMVAMSALYAEAKVVDLIYMVRNMVTPVLMGVGVDYSIYLLYRFREELARGRGKDEAVGETVRFAGETIMGAALTVMAGFGALAAADFRLLQSFGYSLALVVLVALVAALTLTPSVLAALGRRTFWPSKIGGGARGARASYLRRAARLAVSRPVAVIVVFLAITAAAGAVLLRMERTYDYTELMPETQSLQGFKLLSEEFAETGLAQIYIIAEFDEPVVQNGVLTRDAYDRLVSLIATLTTVEGVDAGAIASPVTSGGTVLSYEQASNASTAMQQGLISSDAKSVLLVVSLPYKPRSTEAIMLVGEIRNALRETGVTTYVGGEPAAIYDMNELVNRNFAYRILPAAVVLILLVLYLLLRGAVAALSLLLAIGTSIVWALAALVLVFQYGVGVEIYWLTPIMLVTTILGLGMDYGVFLSSRVKEEMLKGASKEEAILRAAETTGLVITACGLIMAAAFGSLMLSEFRMLQEMGFALASAVLLDTFLVRTLFLPSILKVIRWSP